MAPRPRLTPAQQLEAEIRGQRRSVARHRANVAEWERLSRGHDTAPLRTARETLAEEEAFLAELIARREIPLQGDAS